jgi:ABC-type sugar transport system permease subunit
MIRKPLFSGLSHGLDLPHFFLQAHWLNPEDSYRFGHVLRTLWLFLPISHLLLQALLDQMPNDLRDRLALLITYFSEPGIHPLL